MKMAKLKMKLFLLEIAGFLVSIAPLIITLIINWEKYTSHSTKEALKLGVGAVLIGVLCACAVIGKLKMPGRLVTDLILLGAIYLLEPVLQDVFLILCMDLIGSFMDTVIFSKLIKNVREAIANDKTADATVEKLMERLQNEGVIGGSGRV